MKKSKIALADHRGALYCKLPEHLCDIHFLDSALVNLAKSVQIKLQMTAFNNLAIFRLLLRFGIRKQKKSGHEKSQFIGIEWQLYLLFELLQIA